MSRDFKVWNFYRYGVSRTGGKRGREEGGEEETMERCDLRERRGGDEETEERESQG